MNQTTYTYGPRQNAPPVLSIAAGAGGPSITIHGLDPEGDAITVTPTAPAGLSTSGAKTIPASAMGGDVTFDFNPNDLLNGASGTAEFYGEDGFPRDEYVTVSASVVVPPITLDPDTLYAIPMQRSAAAGDTVTIVVATGVPAHAFQFLNSCRVTAPTGFSYVSNTFNAGEPGGGAGDVDGFWTSMNPGGGFLLPPDNFIVETDLGSGLIGIDFNLTPIGGSDVSTDKGALFNFGANFGVGDNTLGFQAVSGVSRTYYTDSNLAPERFWSDITNDHAGVPNSVEVN